MAKTSFPLKKPASVPTTDAVPTVLKEVRDLLAALLNVITVSGDDLLRLTGSGGEQVNFNLASPTISVYNPAADASSDFIGSLDFRGKDSGGNDLFYNTMENYVGDGTDGSEDSYLLFTTRVAGASSEGLRIATGGTLTNGGADFLLGGFPTRLQISGSPATHWLSVIGGFSNDGNGADFLLTKSRNATFGSHTVVQNGDTIASVRAYASDGDAYIEAARMTFVVNGTPGNNDMPGRIVFYTTPDNSATPVNRMALDSSTTARDTALQIWDVDNANLERVTVGVADSGGSGFKLLRIPN